MANKLEHIKIGSETYDIPSGTYSKPNDGIPKTDLENAVQTSLDKADTAIQNIKTINGESIEGTGDITISGGSGANGIDVTLGNPTAPVTMGYKPYMVNLKKDDEYIASAELPEYTATNIIAPMYMSGKSYKAGDYVYYAHHLQKCIADCQDETPLYPYPPNPMQSDYWEVVSVASQLGSGGGGGGDIHYNPETDMLDVYSNGVFIGSIGAGLKEVRALVPTTTVETEYFFDNVSDSRYKFWNAFRGSDQLCGMVAGNHCGYNFQRKVTIKRLWVKNRNTANRALGRFVLQGSDDKVNWEDVETFTNTSAASLAEWERAVTPTRSYQYWQILAISGTNDTQCNFGRFQFYGY